MRIFSTAVVAVACMPIAAAFTGPQLSRSQAHTTELKAHTPSDIRRAWMLPTASIIGGLTLAGQVAGASVDVPVVDVSTTSVTLEAVNVSPKIQSVETSIPSLISGSSIELSAVEYLDFSMPSYSSDSTAKPKSDAEIPSFSNPFGDFKGSKSEEPVVDKEAEKAAAEAKKAEEKAAKAAADKAAAEKAVADKAAAEAKKAEEKAAKEAAAEAKRIEKEEAEAKKKEAEEAAEAKKAEKEARRQAELEKQRLAVERAKEQAAAKVEPAPTPAPTPAPAPAAPEFKAPDIKIPEFTAPKAPEIKIPEFSAPKIPEFSAPKFSMPKIDLPDVPKVEAPKIDAPKAPSFSIPQTSFEVPKAPSFSAAPSGYDLRESSSSVEENIEPQEVRDERARAARNVYNEADASAKEAEKKAQELRSIANEKKKIAKEAKDEACKTRIGGTVLCIRPFGSGY